MEKHPSLCFRGPFLPSLYLFLSIFLIMLTCVRSCSYQGPSRGALSLHQNSCHEFQKYATRSLVIRNTVKEIHHLLMRERIYGEFLKVTLVILRTRFDLLKSPSIFHI